MDKIILGLLVLKSMTIYEIKGFISNYLSFSYTDSLGSIQYALRKLLELEAIYYETYVENGHNKKMYHISEKGLTSFKEWLEKPVNLSKSKSMEESKMFFIGLAKKSLRIEVLKSYLVGLQQEKEKLLAIQRLVADTKTDPIERSVKHFEADLGAKRRINSFSKDCNLYDTVSDIYKYQMATLRYSLMEIDFQIAFYQDLLSEELGD